MEIEIINKSKNPLPEYKTASASGMDLHVALDEEITLKPMERRLLPTGLYVSIPTGYEGQIRPRSGSTSKTGLYTFLGTIDSDYIGELRISCINLSDESIIVRNGDRPAQLVIAPYKKVAWKPTLKLSETARGENGFGHTGKN